MTDQPKAADSTLHPNWKSLAYCPKCGEFMGHGHECQPAADENYQGKFREYPVGFDGSGNEVIIRIIKVCC
jgi:hypothetical protein